MTSPPAPREYRTLFLSDMHLGTKGCQVGQLLNFLINHNAQTIYLVGDIIDGWRSARAGTGPTSTHSS